MEEVWSRRDDGAPVVVVGAGLAGLCCALGLRRRGVPVVVLEAGDRAGGRVRTEERGGFRLDRGFQVLLPAYPEAREVLDLDALALRPFYRGALVRRGGRFRRVADPLRHPLAALGSLAAGIAGPGDALAVARLWAQTHAVPPAELLEGPDTSTAAALRERGFSEEMVEAFLRPFFSGVFLDPALETSSRAFRFVFRCFADGGAALPSGGMDRIPAQLAAGLPAGTVRLHARVAEAGAEHVVLEGGQRVDAAAVVVATEQAAAHRLLGLPAPPPGRSTTCLYFDAERAPLAEPVLALNGEGDAAGPVNSVCEPSTVAPGYAPEGRTLVSVSVVDPRWQARPDLEAQVRAQLERWFGRGPATWRLLDGVAVPDALPRQDPGDLDPPVRPHRLPSGVFVAGDHRTDASINGAMRSGRLAAEAVAEWLGGRG